MEEVFLPDSRKFILVRPEFIKPNRKSKKDVILSPRDLLYSIIRDFIKSNFGGARRFIYFQNGIIKMEVTIRRSKNELRVEKIDGDDTHLSEFRKILASSGFYIRE